HVLKNEPIRNYISLFYAFNATEFELLYYRHIRDDFDRGYTKFSIRDTTDYLDYVINEPYESQLVITDY
ncbi:hypothetical protein AAUPMC_03279, partial [Pasteurella multocida subsp. multocida str. Anand1_cattle]